MAQVSLGSGLQVVAQSGAFISSNSYANIDQLRQLWNYLYACKECGIALIIKKEESTTEEVLGRITTTNDRIHNCPVCKENRTFEKVY